MIAIFPVFRETATSIEPCDGAFDDPALGFDDEAFGTIASLDDFDRQAAHGLGDAILEDRSCVGAVGEQLAQDLRRADARLNSVYRPLMAKIDAASQARLRDAQRAWIAFRDKECVFRTGGGYNQEGTIWPMLVLKCQTELTTARIRDLQQQLKSPSWDISCPAG